MQGRIPVVLGLSAVLCATAASGLERNQRTIPNGSIATASDAAAAPASPGGPPAATRRGESPLLDLPLRTRFPSRVFLPGLPEVGLAPPGSAFADVDETQLVRLAYDTFSQYSERENGERVEFELGEFFTVYRPQFGKVKHYPDVMTLGTDWEVRTTVRRHIGASEESVWYDAEWVPVPNLSETMPQLVGRSLLDILAASVAELPDQRRVVAVTSYRVRVSYLGRELTYRAAVRWLLDEEQRLTLTVTDNVVPEVGLALGEKMLPLGRRPRPAETDRPFDRVSAASTTTSCTAFTWPTVHSTKQAVYNSLEHSSGRHEAVYIGKFVCSCSSTCQSKCTPGFMVAACQDYGTLTIAGGSFHRPTKEVETREGIVASGNEQGAQCVSGLGCFVQSCPGGACAQITTSVSVGILGISFNTTAATVLKASLDANFSCARCTEIIDNEPTDPGPLNRDDPPPSPIVVDLDRGGFRFSDLAGGVRFDIDGDGAAEEISWLAAGSGDGWLALDRDGDGRIGSGLELFGNFTPQPASDAPHGYRALAVFDLDGDRAITAADAVFGDLRMWIDADHDGVSQPGELSPLAAWGIVAVELEVTESRRRDRHGNELRYAARVRLDRGTTQSADVFLLRE